jgi:transposase
VRRTVLTLFEEVRDLEARAEAVEAELHQLARQEPVVQSLLQISGIGILTATALYASVADIHAFKSGRQVACWLGLTPREYSSGGRQRLGRISKQGDPYVRMLLIHGARAALLAARRTEMAGQPVTQLQAWALKQARETHPNRAAVALANKLARIAWAVWYHDRRFDGNHAQRVAA